MSRNICGCGCWPAAARTTFAWWATTTSRSTAGAAPKWKTSCASRSDFPGAKVIRLERNYRSTPIILGAASGLIAANKGRLGKTLWTEGDPGEKIQRQRRCGTPKKKPAPSPAISKACITTATALPKWRYWCARRFRCANSKIVF